jgi:ribose/xylose/arabinose/galactoside ABC-type transport system permease subunit
MKLRVIERFAVPIVWVLVIAFFSWRSDAFASMSTVKLILSTQTVILIATIGVLLPLAVEEFDLSIGSVVGFGGCLLAVLDGVHHWAPGPAIAVTLLVCALFGAANAALSVLVGVPSIIVTLGMGTLLAGVTLGVSDSKVVTGISNKTVEFMTSPFLFGIPAPFYCGVLLCLVAWFVLQHTPLGRRMIFIAENREVARAPGPGTTRPTGRPRSTAIRSHRSRRLAGLRVNLIRARARCRPGHRARPRRRVRRRAPTSRDANTSTAAGSTCAATRTPSSTAWYTSTGRRCARS